MPVVTEQGRIIVALEPHESRVLVYSKDKLADLPKRPPSNAINIGNDWK
jgi:hypothetical protein